MVWEKALLHSAVQRPRFHEFYDSTLPRGIWLDHLQPSGRKMKRECTETCTGGLRAWPSSDRHHFNPYYVGRNSVICPGGIAEETGRSITFRLSSLPSFRSICYDFIGIIKVPGMRQIFSYGIWFLISARIKVEWQHWSLLSETLNYYLSCKLACGGRLWKQVLLDGG